MPRAGISAYRALPTSCPRSKRHPDLPGNHLEVRSVPSPVIAASVTDEPSWASDAGAGPRADGRLWREIAALPGPSFAEVIVIDGSTARLGVPAPAETGVYREELLRRRGSGAAPHDRPSSHITELNRAPPRPRDRASQRQHCRSCVTGRLSTAWLRLGQPGRKPAKASGRLPPGGRAGCNSHRPYEGLVLAPIPLYQR
jgi:hypothetical protein